MSIQLFVNYDITKNKIKTVVKNGGGRMYLGCSQKLQQQKTGGGHMYLGCSQKSQKKQMLGRE
jgi:hypothetical protein